MRGNKREPSLAHMGEGHGRREELRIRTAEEPSGVEETACIESAVTELGRPYPARQDRKQEAYKPIGEIVLLRGGSQRGS